MNERYDQNRAMLLALIWTRKVFTENSILDEFRQCNKNDLLIGETQTIGEFLSTLAAYGKLTYQLGIYRVVD
jgi:hypothetical protein